MKNITLLTILVLPIFVNAQTNRNGFYAGLTAGYLHYNTSWYYYRFDGRPQHYNYPIHAGNRFVAGLNLEKKGVLHAGDIYFDAGGELLFGPGGKSKGEWLPGEDVISSGGFTLGLNGIFKAAYPLAGNMGSPIHITPVAGLGPQVLMLHNNGKNTGAFASAQYYNYTDGWNEYLFVLQAAAGVDVQLSSFTLTPEIHVGVAGFSSTSWQPNEDGVEMERAPHTLMFAVRLTKKF